MMNKQEMLELLSDLLKDAIDDLQHEHIIKLALDIASLENDLSDDTLRRLQEEHPDTL